MRNYRILQGDVRERLRELPAESAHCCVTSPPYWGLRDYGVPGQLGLERTPDEYVSRMVEVFREVRRVLRPDGTLWLNLGDSYAGMKSGNTNGGESSGLKNDGRPEISRVRSNAIQTDNMTAMRFTKPMPPGLKSKDLVGIPWRVAFALQADGWWLRSDIIWHKPNPMPESVTDRPTKAHEYLFLLAKSERYYYDADAIAEAAVAREPGEMDGGPQRLPAGDNANDGRNFRKQDETGNRRYTGLNDRCFSKPAPFTRNKRTVWTVTTCPFPEAHFATFPTALVEPCILAGSPEGGTVLDPFSGSGTTGVVALRADRNYIGIELNPTYVEMARRRIGGDAPLLNTEVA